jgi:hypothetical protein
MVKQRTLFGRMLSDGGMGRMDMLEGDGSDERSYAVE